MRNVFIYRCFASGGREVKNRRFQIGSEVISVAEAGYSQALAWGRGGHQVTSWHRRHYNDPVCRSPTGRQAAVRKRQADSETERVYI